MLVRMLFIYAIPFFLCCWLLRFATRVTIGKKVSYSSAFVVMFLNGVLCALGVFAAYRINIESDLALIFLAIPPLAFNYYMAGRYGESRTIKKILFAVLAFVAVILGECIAAFIARSAGYVR